MLGEVYRKMLLSQPNRPRAMRSFDGMIAEVVGVRIEEMLGVPRMINPFAAEAAGIRDFKSRRALT